MTHRPPLRAALVGSCMLALGACAAVPGAGPTAGAIVSGASSATRSAASPYVLIDLDTATALRASAPGPAPAAFELPPARSVGLIGPGDLLKITLWEPDTTGETLLARPGLDVSVRVGTDGTIGIPYVGTVRAAGRTPAQIARSAAAALSSQARAVQAAVLVLQDNTNAVTVEGDVAKPGRVPLEPGDTGLSGILSAAGGARGPAWQETVRVTRDGRSEARPLSVIVSGGIPDLRLSPGDEVAVLPHRRFFYAFGAVNHPGEQAYEADASSMTRTLARIAGLDDMRASPEGVFVFRRQNAETTRKVLGRAPAPGQDPTRVVYRLNLRDPNGFFVAQNFRVMPGDVIYVSDAPVAEAAKALQIISGLSSIAAMPRNMGAPY